MRITQGTFSFLPDLTDEQIRAQVEYILQQGWAPSIEFTDDPHPRNTYWELWGLPMFDLKDAAGVLMEVRACRAQYPDHYIKVNAFDSTHGFETLRRIPSNDRERSSISPIRAAVAERLAQVVIPADDYFIWLTGEGAAVKSLLARFEGEEIDPQLVRSQAYWHSK